MNTITVDLFEYKKGSSPDILEALPGPCLAICFYHAKSKSGYMGLMPLPQSSRMWNELITVVTDEHKPGELEVTLTGMSINPEFEDAKDVRQGRVYIEDFLRKHKFTNVKKRYSNSILGRLTHFELSTGKVVLKYR